MGHSIALRVGVGISLRTEATDQGFDFSGTTENHAENDLTNSRHVYTADCQLLWYKGDRLSWYWGAGPRVAYSGFRRESGDFRVVGDEVQTVSERYEFEQWGAGLAAILGLRFQLNDTFSLDAQYGSALMFVHSTVSARQAFSDAVSTSRRTSDDTDTVEVKPDAVRLAVSAFF